MTSQIELLFFIIFRYEKSFTIVLELVTRDF